MCGWGEIVFPSQWVMCNGLHNIMAGIAHNSFNLTSIGEIVTCTCSITSRTNSICEHCMISWL